MASNPNGNDPLLTALGWAHAILLVDYDNDGDIDVLLSMKKCHDSSGRGPPSYNLLKNGGSATSGDISGVFSGVDAGIAAGLDEWETWIRMATCAHAKSRLKPSALCGERARCKLRRWP